MPTLESHLFFCIPRARFLCNPWHFWAHCLYQRKIAAREAKKKRLGAGEFIMQASLRSAQSPSCTSLTFAIAARLIQKRQPGWINLPTHLPSNHAHFFFCGSRGSALGGTNITSAVNANHKISSNGYFQNLVSIENQITTAKVVVIATLKNVLIYFYLNNLRQKTIGFPIMDSLLKNQI